MSAHQQERLLSTADVQYIRDMVAAHPHGAAALVRMFEDLCDRAGADAESTSRGVVLGNCAPGVAALHIGRHEAYTEILQVLKIIK